MGWCLVGGLTISHGADEVLSLWISGNLNSSPILHDHSFSLGQKNTWKHRSRYGHVGGASLEVSLGCSSLFQAFSFPQRLFQFLDSIKSLLLYSKL